MRITNITNSLSFTAGKVQVYSDFDGTYCPTKHSSIRDNTNDKFIEEYCAKMNDFFQKTENDLHFHITTGRTYSEYEAISQLLKKRGYKLPLPESFIAKNGSDEYFKQTNNSDFYQNDKFPFNYKKTNLQKEENIRKATGWNGEAIKNFIKNLAEKYKLRFVEAGSENSVRDYGENSLFSKGKLNPDDWQKLPISNGKIKQHDKPVVDYALGARKDGNLKINLIFSPDYGYCRERNYIYDTFMNEIKDFLQKENIDYNMSWDIPSKHNHYRNHCNITPNIEGKALTKLYDTKEAFKKAVREKDMVVVAGDGSNDFDMLNPLEYIDKQEWAKFKENSKCKEFYNADMRNKTRKLKEALDGKNSLLKQELETNGFIDSLKQMPLYSIVIKKDNSELKLLADVFGRFNKVVEVEKGELDKGLKEVIKYHSGINGDFKTSMSDKFKKYILGSVKKKSNTKPLLIASIVGILGMLGIYFYTKNRKSNNK